MAGHRHAGKVDLRVLGLFAREFRAVARLRRHGRVSGWEAGRGNRTLVFSLEGYCSTIELHPRRTTAGSSRREPGHTGLVCWAGVLGWHLGAWHLGPRHTGQWGVQDSNLRRNNPSDLQSDPFDRSGNSPRALPPWGSGSDGCFGCVPVGCPWWMPAGSLRVVDVTSGCERGCAGGFRDCVTTGIAVLSCVLKSGRHWRLAGHAELAAGVEPATC